ncbi:MAG: autotransporter outer membrane beta-barrel domain-containing protein [Citrobacter sp.]
MNKVFKIVWNAGLQCWVVVSEIAKSHGKTKSERRLAKRAGKAAMGVLGGMALLSAANASTLIWSPTGQSSGGSGTWDTSSSAWYNGTITMPWNNAAGDSAWFGAPGGTVTLAGLIRVQDLSFTTDGYILTGGTLDTFSSQSLVNVSSGATATIDSLISGSGMLALTGGGKLTLTGANTYAGGTSVSGGSVLEVSSDNNLGAAAGVLTLGNPSTMGTLNITGAFNGTRNVTLNLGGGNINVSPGVTATFNGVVSGSGALNLTGTGTTVLNGANTWTGTTTIGSGGTLQVGTGGTTGTLGTGATVNNGVLAFNRSNAYTYGGAISGTGSLQNIGSGTTTLSGANTFTGGVLVSAGKLVLTNANNSVSGSTIASGATLELNGGASSISGNIANNGALIFSRGAAYTFAGIISGTGTVNQNAGNWITLTGANTYSGGTFIGGNGGIIVNNDNNLGAASGSITFNNGTGYFQAPSAFATSRTITVNSGATGFFSSSSGTITLASPIVGAGSFGVNGGTVILTGTNNTYSGTTNINGGTLQINDESNLSSNAAGGITYTGGGFLRVMSSGALTRNIAMNANGNFDAYNGSVITLNGTVSGGGRLYFYGGGTPGGTVLLTGNNTHTGGIGFWTGSRVVVASDSNMGAATGLLQFNGGTLATTATFASGRAVDLNGAGAIDVASATTLTMNGVVSGGGRLTKANTGTLVLSGANTWTGGTTISGGTLQIGNGGTSGSFGTGNVTNNGTLAFNRSDINSYNNVISGTGAVVQSGNGSTTLSANNTYTGATTVSAGTLYVNGNQSSATGLTTVSSGATLGGNGTIGGSVTVADGGTLTPGASADATGTLTIRGNLALSSGAVLNYNLGQAGTVGGSLNDLTVVNGNLTLAGTLNVTTSTGGTFDAGVYRIISYAGSLTNNGMVLGSLPAGANATLQTSVAGQVNLINNYAGTIFWDGATGHDNSIIDGGSGIWNTGVGANSNWTDGSGVANGAYSTNFAVFQGSPGTVTVDNSQGQVAVTGMQFMADGYRISGDSIELNETTAGSGFSTLRVGDGTAVGSGYTATIDAILGGFTGLSKTDLGTLILTGANTYTGGTNISGGTLQLGDGTTNGSVLGNIANAGTLALKPASGTSMAVSGVVSGSGSLKMIGTGTAVLTGTNTYTGGTTISSGTLQIGDGTTNGTLPGNVVNNAALVFMPKTATTLNYGGVISGTGTVTQNGPGTAVFTGANTYTGGTIISSGVLQLGDGTSNNDGSIAGSVTNNGTLAFRFNGSKTVSNVISGSGNVSQLSGTTTLSGVNTYTGGTTLNGGLLFVSNDNNLGDISGRLTFNGGILQTTGNIARDIVITANGGRVYNTNGSTLSGNISGTGALEFQSGTTYITGNNTSSGGIILSEYGTVVINSANAVGTGKITGRSQDAVYGGGGNLRTTATMTLANDVDFGFTSFYGSGSQQSVGFITDAGTTLTMTGNFNWVGGYRPANGISKSGAGTMVLANASFQDGGYPVRVYAGTLIVGDGGTRGTVGAASVQISSGAALKFNRSNTYVYSGSMSGAGSFEQIGSGTLVLTGDNTQTGGSTITSGTVQLGNGGNSGWISGNITNNGTLAFNRSDNVTWSNLISGTGSLSKLGTNTLTLTGTQAYTGGTTINAGILQLGDGTTDGSIIGNVNMAGGALAFNASNGSMTDQNALISGAGGVTKLGLGTTILKGANTYTGATTVSAGTLYIDGNQSAATGATTVANGATLGGTGTIGGNVTIANGATLMPGSENGTGGTLTINGNLALNDLSILNYQFGKVNGVAENTRTDVNGNLTLDGRLNVSTPAGGTFSAGVYRVFNYNGTLTNNGLVLGTVPAGTTLALQSTVPGQVNLINSTGQLLAFWDGMNSANYNQGSGEGGTGTWRLLGQTSWADVSGSSNSAYGNRSFAVFGGTAGTVTVDNAFGQVETSGMQFTTTGYVLNGGVIALVNSPVDGSTPELRVGDGSDASRNMTATIASVLQGATSVTKTDLGTLVLTGNNTWTGGTRVNGGVLQVSSDANLGATSGALSFDGGTLATTTSFNTARTTTLNTGGGTLDTAAGTTLTMSGIIGGTGSLTKTNSGTLLLTGTNTWTGGTAINGGIVQVSADANLGAATGPLSFDGGTLATTTSFNTGRATTLNAGGGTLDTAAGTTLTMSGVVSGSGALTKTNTGTLTLTNSNTWSGGTTISGGSLQLGNGGTGGSLTGNVTNNGTLAFNRSDTSTLAGVISGSGVVNQIGTGKTILSGINTYSGGTTISAGTLVAQNGAALGTGAVANNAALQLDFAADGTLANVLSGNGALTKTGSGIATLTATGSAQGAVTVSGGTLAFGQSGAFNAASMNVASGGAITVNPISNIVLSGAYTQSAGATFNGVADTQAKTAVTAATASLNGTLNITGFGIAAPVTASGLTGTQYTVVHTTNGITGDFSSVNLNGAASTVDYLRLAGRVSGNDYNVGYGLSWLEGQAYGTGSFTLAGASDVFNVDVALGNQAAGTYTSGWDGKTLTKAGAGSLTLSSVNTYTGDTLVNGGTLKAGIANAFAQSANVAVASGATLDLNNFNQTAHNLSGAGNVTLGSAMLTENAVSDTTFSGTLSGTGGLTKTGSGVFTLSGNNTYSGGTTVSAGTLQLGDGGTSGAITGNVTNNGTLAFNRSDATTFAGVISGSGHVTQVGTGKTIFTGTHTYSGGTTVSAGTLQLGNGGTTGSVQGGIDIASGATLAVDWGADYTVNNTLTGSGLVAIKAAGNDVNFASAATGAGFNGVVDLQNATFTLGGVNTGALAAATLRLGSGSVTTVADGTQSIGSLVFNSGKAIFNATVPAQVDATSLVQANLLDTSGTGTVQVTLPTPYVLPTPAPSTDLSLLEQDDVNLGTRLVAASTAIGSAGALELQDQNGNAITAAQQINIQQGGNLVALGTYDYRLSTGANQDGLYVSYGLKQLDLQAGQTLTLAQNSGATGASADMSAKITGSGSLQVDAGTGIVSLSNTTNDFTGDTTVAIGALQAGALDVIATSANVTVNAGATLDTNGYYQSLTNLSGDGTVTNGTATDTILTLNDTATSVFAGDITGAQLALVQASGTQVLAGSNTYGGGTTINTGATLQLGNGGTRGSIAGNVTNDGTLAFNRSDTATFNGVISGTGRVDQTGTGRTILTGVNSYSGGSTISAGTLQLNDSQAAGTGAISVNTTAGDVGTGLDLAFSDASDFSNLLIGEGTTTVSGAQATITGANAGYTGNWRVTDTGTLAVATDAVSSTDNLGTGGVDIAADGIVNLLTQGEFSFNNALTGAGTLNASGHGQAFSFGSGVGSAFTGMAVLTDNTFALSGDNTTALTHGKLSVGTGNVTTVGDGNQQIGGLIINDGTVVFNATAPDEILATSLITADTLDISHTGTVYINAPASYVPHARDTDNSLNLLMQDEGNTGVQLVKSTSVTGSGGAIQLLNKDGSKITAERTIDINQNGDVVALGTYDYRLTSGANADGLYVNYGLTELDLQADKTLTLAQDTGAINASADMSAKVTGSGNLVIEAGAGVVSLSNATNDYTGETKVSTGTLRSDVDNALGKTSLLSLANTAGFDLNGKTQTVGKLNGDAGSLLNVNGGTLALSNGGVSAGSLTGAGKLSVLGGTLDVRGANTGLSVVSQISKGATASLNNVAGLGSGNIITDGTLALNGAVGTMTNNISGTGELVKQGAGEVVLTGQTGWTGNTHIDGGELVLDGSRGGAQLVSNVIAKDNTSLSLRNGASLTGWIDPTDVSIDSASRWNMTADSLVDDVKLAGTINFAAPSTQSMTAGRTLTTTNWQGQDGTVVMNTALGGDTSVTDKIVISGNTSGNTFVKVNNVGGRGAQTIEGIQVVKVGGQSDGTFTKSGRIVAGIYDYSLVKKGADWYLTSLDTSTKDKKGTSGIRPESASYTANLAAANTMFVHRLHDREGETQYTDVLTGEQKVTSMWLRQVGGHNRWSSSVGQVDTQSNRYVTQLGGEVAQWSPDGVQRLHVGVMAGYGRNSSNSRSNATGYRSDGSVNGYSTGLYATWYQNDETKQGMYVDSWAQYGWFDNTVKGEKVQSESYKSKGITASLELGYTHKLGDFTGSQGTEGEWFIQPQAQAVWMGVTADDHYESNGTRVTGEGDGNVQTRLGVRTFLKSHNKLDEGKNRNFKPYVEINWIHNTQSFGSHMGDATLSQDGARNVGEVKAGVEGQLNSRLSVWGNVGVQVGDKGYSDTSATLGVKYNF